MKGRVPMPPLSFLLFCGDTDFKPVGCEKYYLCSSYKTNDDESGER